MQYSALPTFPGQLLFQDGYFLKRPYFEQELLFQNSYFFTTYFFKRDAILQLRFLSTSVSNEVSSISAGYSKSLGILSCVYIIAQIRVIDRVHVVSRLHKVLWNCYFLGKLLFQSFFFLRSLPFQCSYTLSPELHFQKILFFRTANFQQLTSFLQL